MLKIVHVKIFLLRCDRRNDCGDSSDEQGCTYQPCQQHQFTCQNGRCISHDFVCDGDNDCGDESDELEQVCHTPAPTCPPAEFRCDNGHCIPLTQVCNRNDDCSDNSDEKGCGEWERILHLLMQYILYIPRHTYICIYKFICIYIYACIYNHL